MIELTRLNGSPLYVNADLIRYAEASPDTVLTMITSEKLLVRESCAEVAARTIAFRAGVLAAAWPDAATAFIPRATIQSSSVPPQIDPTD